MTLRLTRQVREALVHFRENHARPRLFPAIARSLRTLPGQPNVTRARPERWQTPWGQAWAVAITTDNDRWLAVYQHDDTHTTVLYLGPHDDTANP